jgi:F-type H+-transporting ATPase subunit b
MEKLGIQVPLLLTQIVNFIIMIAVLTKLLYKPILKGLKSRQEKIAQGLAFSENAKLEEEKLAKKRQELLNQARQEGREILEESKKEAKKLKEEIIASGREEINVLRARMEKEIATKAQDMEKEISGKTVDIASEMVKRLLKDVLNDSHQHAFIGQKLKEIEKIHER